MRSKQQLISQQREWALRVGLNVDARGYLDDYAPNLRVPLSQKAKRSFDDGSGSELKDTPSRPAKMKALHSSSALAVNVFDYWLDSGTSVLQSALGLEPVPVNITFEKQYPTGLPGNPPNLDVSLEYAGGKAVGIESKYSEWLNPKSKNKAPFKDKYFDDGSALWKDSGLPNCQQLAEAMREKEVYFRHLDVAQLLKHVLGMATQLGDKFSLYYIYYDWNGPESDAHGEEVERFASMVGEEVRFKTKSYQEFFNALNCDDADYMNYLRDRYFSV